MCGLAGYLQRRGEKGRLEFMASAMADRIRHRGPDDGGVWSDPDSGFAVAHRRLSIIDLSPAGHQPMHSASGRWVLAYNGEIYNHMELRTRLQAEAAAPTWRGHSDTETLLAALEAWGVEEALKRCVGMFAFALWNRVDRVLFLARDRMGEKPMYYGWQGDTFLFGSELKALTAHPAFSAEVDRGAMALMLRHSYVPAPHTIYSGIRKLPPGTFLRISQDVHHAEPMAYWSLAEVAESGTSSPFDGTEDEAIALLEQRLCAAVRGQMISDVPLGALLSGGVDSSTVVALMQAHSPRPIRTFTIGFEEQEYDEARYAKRVAAHLGTDHTELQLGADDALTLIPSMPEIYDEPFADSSQLPTHLVMRLAQSHVTVALSGDGGDEIFGGYSHYLRYPSVWRQRYAMPLGIRRVLGAGLTALPAGMINRICRPLGRFTGGELAGDKMRAIGTRLRDFRSFDDLYVSQISAWDNVEDLVVGGQVSENLLDRREWWPSIADNAARMMVMDGLTYLPDCILVKVDRAAMAVSLETRAPFLDKDVIEFAWSLPGHMKLRAGQGKWLLRRVLERHMPGSIVERPKKGFSIPIDQWLRGPLRDWAETLLAEDRLSGEGLLHPKPIRAAWKRHIQGEADLGKPLWTVLMFQAWLEANVAGLKSAQLRNSA
jgi:asparagine synthase (glutamine-hydrolysing)